MTTRNGDRGQSLTYATWDICVALLGVALAACDGNGRHVIHINNIDHVDLRIRIDTTDDCCHWEQSVVAGRSAVFRFQSTRDLSLRVKVSSDNGSVEATDGYLAGYVGSEERRRGTCVTVTKQQIAKIQTCRP